MNTLAMNPEVKATPETATTSREDYNDVNVRRLSGVVMTVWKEAGRIESVKIIVFPWEVFNVHLDEMGIELGKIMYGQEVEVSGRIFNRENDKWLILNSYKIDFTPHNLVSEEVAA